MKWVSPITLRGGVTLAIVDSTPHWRDLSVVESIVKTDILSALKRQLEQKWRALDNFESLVKKLETTRSQWRSKYAIKDGELEAAKVCSSYITLLPLRSIVYFMMMMMCADSLGPKLRPEQATSHPQILFFWIRIIRLCPNPISNRTCSSSRKTSHALPQPAQSAREPSSRSDEPSGNGGREMGGKGERV